ncbi:transposable element Tcb1 transposase [Trichonephila clavipes]|nr:transposable element Tcb1 transposase [Trichonephila clavipes]
MSSRHYIDDFMRGRIIGKIEEGRKIADVVREFDIAHSVVSRLWKSFKTTGMCSRRHGGGRVRSTTPAEDTYIVLSAKRNRRTTAQQVANQFLAASGKQISRKTVARRLRGGGLYARRPVVCVPLTRQHRTARLQWCREHHNWTEQDWACVLFSDESRFSLSSDCRRQLIWRESGTAYRPENIQEKDRYPTCSIMVWAGIMINGRMCLHGVANGTMTANDTLMKFYFLMFVFSDCLDSEGIQRLVWPARSPDLIPIENVWDASGRQVAGRNYPPTNKNTLIRALTEEWDKLPQQLLDNVVQSIWLEHWTPDRKAWVRCHQTPSEYTRSTCLLNQWVRSLVGLITSAETGEYFPTLQFTCKNCGGGDRGRVAIYRPFGEFCRAKIILSPVWCSRPTTGVPLAHATMNFVGLDLTTSDRKTSGVDQIFCVAWHLASRGRKRAVNWNSNLGLTADYLTSGFITGSGLR